MMSKSTLEIIDEIYEKEIGVVRAVCHNYLGTVLMEEKLQDVVIFHLRNFRHNLETALEAKNP